MTSQSKHITSSSAGGGAGTSNGSRKAGGSGGGGGGGGGVGVGGVGATKNTRRRIHQKRTRNTNRPKTNEDKVKQPPPSISSKPVLESTNPFFIAVCAPESYRPSSSSGTGLSLSNNHRSNNGGGRGGGRDGNRRSDTLSVSQHHKPNVFLRQQNNRTSFSSSSSNGNTNVTTGGGGCGGVGGGGSGAMNHFIHHPIIQNDRQRGGDSTSGVAVGVGAVTSSRDSGALHTNNMATTNIHDKEQFPSLSSGGSSSVPVTKLNFKEMMMRSSSGGGGTVSEGGSGGGGGSGGDCGGGRSVVSSYVPKVRSEYSQKASLSSGNIFLGAFYGSRNNEYVDEDDVKYYVLDLGIVRLMLASPKD
jgi:hypothetical protein